MQEMIPATDLRRPYARRTAMFAAAMLLAGACCFGSCVALEAQTIPATQPTALPAPISATPLAKGSVPATRPQVSFRDGMLDVRANNSSLHSVLRAIASATGMKITGGIADERVFGNYGPAAPATVLATLLDGTGTNILLREGDGSAPVELILTPRTGGATPPNPTPIGFDAEDAPAYQQPATQNVPQNAPQRPSRPGVLGPNQGLPNPADELRRRVDAQASGQNQPAQSSTPQSIPQPLNNVNGSPTNSSPTASTLPTTNSVPIDSVSTPVTTPPAAQGIVDTPNPPAPGSTTGASPNGVKTPEQIYQQLLLMQQKQQQTPPATTPPPPGQS